MVCYVCLKGKTNIACCYCAQEIQCDLWELWVGRLASEVTLQLIKSKCLPIHTLYGLKACPLTKSDLHSLDFVINRLFMKLFKTSNMETVKNCQEFLGFEVYPVLYGANVSISLNLNLQSSLALISLLVFNGTADI